MFRYMRRDRPFDEDDVNDQGIAESGKGDKGKISSKKTTGQVPRIGTNGNGNNKHDDDNDRFVTFGCPFPNVDDIADDELPTWDEVMTKVRSYDTVKTATTKKIGEDTNPAVVGRNRTTETVETADTSFDSHNPVTLSETKKATTRTLEDRRGASAMSVPTKSSTVTTIDASTSVHNDKRQPSSVTTALKSTSPVVPLQMEEDEIEVAASLSSYYNNILARKNYQVTPAAEQATTSLTGRHGTAAANLLMQNHGRDSNNNSSDTPFDEESLLYSSSTDIGEDTQRFEAIYYSTDSDYDGDDDIEAGSANLRYHRNVVIHHAGPNAGSEFHSSSPPFPQNYTTTNNNNNNGKSPTMILPSSTASIVDKFEELLPPLPAGGGKNDHGDDYDDNNLVLVGVADFASSCTSNQLGSSLGSITDDAIGGGESVTRNAGEGRTNRSDNAKSEKELVNIGSKRLILSLLFLLVTIGAVTLGVGLARGLRNDDDGQSTMNSVNAGISSGDNNDNNGNNSESNDLDEGTNSNSEGNDEGVIEVIMPVEQPIVSNAPTSSPSSPSQPPVAMVSTANPAFNPTGQPTFQPTPSPTFPPTPSPTFPPTFPPTPSPSRSPTFFPTPVPTERPTESFCEEDSVSVSQSCLDSQHMIIIDFVACNPDSDWVGLYSDGSEVNSSDGSFTIDDSYFDWAWTCGSKDCNSKPSSGSLALPVTNPSLGALALRVYLNRDEGDGRSWDVLARSQPFVLVNPCS